MQSFPNGVDWWGGQFGQNGQKLHEIDKTSIFGSNQWVGEGHGGGQAIFSGSVGDPPSDSPPHYGKPCLCENMKDTCTFKSKHLDEIHKINKKYNCNSKMTVYLMECQICAEQ